MPYGDAVPELSQSGPSPGSIRIPEVRNAPMTERVQSIVDHPAFQRLRRIRQLGPIHFVYPGAQHTRFEHTLGVYTCVLDYLRHLQRTPAFRDRVDDRDLSALIAASLVHDLGHYPFAHSLEALHLKGRETPHHEHVGADIIRGDLPSLTGPTPIGEILAHQWEVDPERVIRLCTGDFDGDPSDVDALLHSIMSGAIDADKMDYLERDSHHMGVPYGRNFDRDRLLASLTLNEAGDGIAITSKGKVPAEMFIFARYTMFSEAYWHHTVRAAAAMVEAALAAHYSRNKTNPTDFLDVLIRYDDDRLLHWIREQSPAGSAAHRLVSGMLDHRRDLYKRILTLSRVYNEQHKRDAYRTIFEMDASSLFSLTDRLRGRLSSVVGRSLHPADLIIDTPPRDKDALETVDVMYPDASGQRYYPLHDLSRIVAGIQDDFAKVVKKIRIFAAPQLAADLQSADADIESVILTEILDS